MEIDIISIISSLLKSFFQSGFFYYFKILAAFVIAILLIADILLLSKRLQADVKVALYGSKAPRLKKSQYSKRWEEIEKALEMESESARKIALIQADQMFGEVLGKIGYSGKATGEKIVDVKPGQLEGIEGAVGSHEIYKKVVQDENFKMTADELQKAIAGYEKVF